MSEKQDINSNAVRSGSASLSGSLDGPKAGKVLQVDLEDEQLFSMGYEQHMRRGFNAWSMTAFCLTGLGLLPSVGGTLWYSLGYLGLMPMTWGWLAASFFIMTMVFSIAEMSSAMPTAGGLYYWTFKCAPPKLKKVSCWITAWSMVMSTALSGASFFMTQAQMIQALVVMFHPDFDPTAWQLYLIYLGCLIVCGMVMVLPSNILGKISNVFAWLGTVTFFVLLIALPIYAHKNRSYNTAHDMFFSRVNQTGFKNEGLVFLLTFLAPCWCISGYDSTAHLSEETENASVVVPRAMWTSCVFIAIVGYIFNVVLAYAAVDLDGILGSPLGQPLAAIMVSAMGDGAFPKLLWICTVLSNFGIVFVMNTSGTRIFWAYARDGALPFSRFLSAINKTTRTPMNASVTLSAVFALIGLISLGSTTALQAFFSGSSVTGAAAYLMPVLMRCLYEDNPEYVPGPFTLGRLSRPIRWTAALWTIFTLPLLAFPSTAHPDASTFNWSVVFYVGMFVIVLPWYFLRARKWFTGPGENVRSE
ncbi:amino acid permease [Grosmannia clavigera kw1407]|uniref:Amino acid permease n=1 Tax=Grosmannia clavigera (strain kw1407 / UAMH 11150) TaxID=655863 RepID=F0XB39_GROCL|nr:amino acid permease [Grosmannia clavigera kw1407]EFX04896.1 amino acid permease [Grosmannia clavigera kw1407]